MSPVQRRADGLKPHCRGSATSPPASFAPQAAATASVTSLARGVVRIGLPSAPVLAFVTKAKVVATRPV